MNAGIATIAEVSKYKKEIAPHGDTMNTAASIQGQCNELKQELLIYKRVRNDLSGADILLDKLGRIALKGKKKDILLYAVHQTNGRKN